MKIPRDLYGRDLAAVLCRRWDYKQVNQVGSHIILRLKCQAITVCLSPTTSRCALAP